MATKVEARKPQPFLKWAGGKRSILAEITELFPAFEGRYIEPFVGAGAVFFSLAEETPKVLNDFNSELVEVYEVIRDSLPQLLRELKKHKNDKEHFLRVRAMDRKPSFIKLSPVVRAARFIYLNKTCFNGLYRVNRSGQFNVPFGRQANPDFIAQENLGAVSNFLNASAKDGNRPQFSSGDYKLVTALARTEDFVYLDPPYDPLPGSDSFVSYQKNGFSRQDQEELRDEILRLTELGVQVLLSNSDTPYIRTLYKDRKKFRISGIQVTRAIGASASSRGKIGEVLVTNQPGIKNRSNS